MTRNSGGISEKLGSLYVLAAWVDNRPRLGPSPVSQRRSSRVSQPAPCTKPPSTWPRSTSGERLSPTSCTMSTRRSVYAPVNPSTSTSLAAAPYAKYLNGSPCMFLASQCRPAVR